MARNTKANEDQPASVADVTVDAEEVPQWATVPMNEQELVPFDPAPSQYRRALEGHELIQYIAANVNQYDEDDPRMALEIAAQIAKGGTVESVLGGGETTKGDEVYGVILAIEHIKFTVSAHEKGCPYFAICFGKRTDNQEQATFTLGGWRTVLQLGQLHYLASQLPAGSPYSVPEGTEGAFAPESYPFYFKLMQSEQTSRGFRVNYLASPMS